MERDRRPAPTAGAGPPIPRTPAELPTAADLQRARDSAEPATSPAKGPPSIDFETSVWYRGRVFVLRPKLPLDKLDLLCDRLDQMGAEPLPVPVSFSPDGEPYCPKHRVPMQAREKQGDTWHSHKVVDASGHEAFCKGRPGKDSPGWDLP